MNHIAQKYQKKLRKVWYVMNKIEVDIHIRYKICINQLFMLLISLLVNRLLVAKFRKSLKLYPHFQLPGVGVGGISYISDRILYLEGHQQTESTSYFSHFMLSKLDKLNYSILFLSVRAFILKVVLFLFLWRPLT